MPTPEVLGRNGTYVVFRKLHTRVAAYRQYLRAKAASREEEALLGAKMVGRWQSGAPLALSPEQDDPELGADRRRNNDFLYADDLRGFKCPAGAHARRANPRDALDHEGSVNVRLHRMIRRGTSYGPMLPEGVLEDDGADRGIIFVFAGASPQAPVRVRQDPMAERRHLHRRPGREGPARRAERRLGDLHHSHARRSAAGCRSCHRSSSPAAASTASPQACARLRWLARARDVTGLDRDRGGRRDNELDKHRPLEGTRLRSAAVRSRGARLPRARRLSLRRSHRGHHPQPATRRQRDHHRDGRPPDRDRRDDRGPSRRPRRHPHRSRGREPSPWAATCASART